LGPDSESTTVGHQKIERCFVVFVAMVAVLSQIIFTFKSLF